MTVYLRPQPAATPVDYMRSLEKNSLLVLPKRYLAIYTCNGANPGPTGATGAIGPGTIIASCSDEFSALIVDLAVSKTTFRAPYAMSLVGGGIRISLTTAPTGAKLIVDVKMNGVTMFSTKVSIDIGETTSVTAAVPAILDITDVPDDAEFTVFVTQIGSTFAGSGLKVAVTGTKGG